MLMDRMRRGLASPGARWRYNMASMAARWHPRLRRWFLRSNASPDAYLAGFVALAGSVVSLLWIVELVANRNRGLDASDESYYLLTVEFPHASRAAATGFDSFLAPIWWLSGKSIGRFRIAGVAALLAAVVAATWLCSRAIARLLGWSIRAVAPCIAAGLAALTLSSYTLWLPTPGYNLVVLVSALVVAGLTACLALSPVEESSGEGVRSVCARMEVALGCVLAIGVVAKAPAFAIIGVLSCGALVVAHGPKLFILSLWRVAAGFVLGLLFFVLITGSPSEIARRFSRGLHAGGLLGSHGSVTLWETTAMHDVYGPWFIKYLVGALLIGLLWRFIRRDNVRLLITIAGSVVTAFAFGRGLPGGGPAALSGNAGWWWVRLSAMTLLWATANARGRSRMLALGPLVSLMAVGAAAGSGNGVVHEVVLTVGVFGVGALVHGLVVVSSRRARNESAELESAKRPAANLLPIALFFVVGSLASNCALRGALAAPYRLNGGLNDESEPVDLGEFGKINVHPDTARYVRELQAIAKRVPADARDCLVDVAGGTPLSAIALGVQPAASPWILGGYPGSNEFASYVLTGSPCLSGPYILIQASSGQRSIAVPSWLDTSDAIFLGRVRYNGYIAEDQLIWLIPG